MSDRVVPLFGDGEDPPRLGIGKPIKFGAHVYADWHAAFMDQPMVRYSEVPQKFWREIGYFLIACAIGRNAQSVHVVDGIPVGFGTFHNMYLILIGPAGYMRKSTTINKIRVFLEALPLTPFIESTMSAQALNRALTPNNDENTRPPHGNPSRVDPYDEKRDQTNAVIATSELEELLRTRTSESSMIDLLRSNYNSDTHTQITITRGTEQPKNLFLSMISGTTMAWLQTHLKDTLVGDGFVSRATFVPFTKEDEEGELYLPFGTPKAPIPSDLIMELVDFTRYEFGYEITWTDEAAAAHATWYRPWRKSKDESMARMDEHIVTRACLIALSRRSDQITLDIYREASEQVTHLRLEWTEMRGDITGSKDKRARAVVDKMLETGPKNLMEIYNEIMKVIDNSQHVRGFLVALRDSPSFNVVEGVVSRAASGNPKD